METGTVQLKRSCKKFKKILRGLSPNPDTRHSLEFGDREYNPHIYDTELLRLGIQVHHIDIETGSISPPGKIYFLPRTDFPDISDSSKQNISLNEFWGDGILQAAEPKDEKRLFSDESDIFAPGLVLTFEQYSFEGNRDIASTFDSLWPPEGVPPTLYGWIYDQ
jgi:hypothetical protein